MQSRHMFREVYKIDESKLQLPQECYSDEWQRCVGIVSPSRYFYASTGGYGEKIRLACRDSEIERLRLCANNRTLKKSIWRMLRHEERLKARELAAK